MRRDVRRRARRRGPRPVQRRLLAARGARAATAASFPKWRRGHISRTCPPRWRRRSRAPGVRLEDVGPRRGDRGPRADRGAARRALGRQGARVGARDPARGREPSRGPPLLGLPATDGEAPLPITYPLPRPRRLGRPRGARARGGRTASCRSRAPGTTRPEKPSTRSRGAPAWVTRAGPSSTASRRGAAATASRFLSDASRRLARFLLLGPEDGDAPPAPAARIDGSPLDPETPRPGGARRPARVLPARHRGRRSSHRVERSPRRARESGARALRAASPRTRSCAPRSRPGGASMASRSTCPSGRIRPTTPP